MFITFKKWTAIYVCSMFVLICLFAIMVSLRDAVPASNFSKSFGNTSAIILDPGHGGEDGGAVGADGTIESKINLMIAQKAADIARLMGWNVFMTRDCDISVHDPSAETLRQKKVSDLKNRVLFCEKIQNSTLISIHQNSLLGASSVRGAQAFYNNAEESKDLAEQIQYVLNDSINHHNQKSAKPIGDNSYLMKHVSCPAVLIECGFLSNPEESALLNTEEHQKKIAVAIIASVASHIRK